MIIRLADWQFRVDFEATMAHTTANSHDHCTCAYCTNYYEAVDGAHPYLRPFLGRFGICLDGPSELMPFEPTLVSACYRVQGRIIRSGSARMHLEGVPVRPEEADENSFFLWVGEMEIPWLQGEPPEDVISPANEPEFMERMMARWLKTRENHELN